MTIKRIIPTLWVTDINATINFYCDLLGFCCIERHEENAVLELADMRLRISLPFPQEPFDHPHFTGSLYFEPENVDALWSAVKDKTQVIQQLSDYANGQREFSIRDINGYMLQFGVPIQKPEPYAHFVIA